MKRASVCVLCCLMLHPAVLQAAVSGDSLMRDVEHYAALGEHRSGGAVDAQTTAWLAERLKKAGYAVEMQKVVAPQHTLEKISLRIDGAAYEAFPVWPVTATEGIRAPLAMFDPERPGLVSGKIAVTASTFGNGYVLTPQAAERLAEIINAGAVAVLYIPETLSGDLMPMNVPLAAAPRAVPVVNARFADLPAITKAAAEGRMAELVVKARFNPQTVSYNVIARHGAAAKTIVVSTPTTGWFTCAGERGPGIALFLALAEEAAARRAETCGYIFVATTFHERNGAGMDAFIGSLRQDVALWVHLGSSIANWSSMPDAPETQRVPDDVARRSKNLSASESLTPLLTRRFDGVFGYTPVSGRTAGEMKRIFDSGYVGFGLWGFNKYFHSPNDTPASTGPELLFPVWSALNGVLVDVENGKL